MKKLLILSAVVLCFCSCKQAYTCRCTASLSYEIEEVTKSDAATECDTHDNICPAGVQCVTSWDCGLE